MFWKKSKPAKNEAVMMQNSVIGQMPWYMKPLAEQLLHIERAPKTLQPYLLQFAKDGVIVVENAVKPAICDAALEAFDALTRRNAALFDPHRDSSGYLSRIINLHLALPEFLQIYLQNAALPLLEFIFGAKPSLYTTLYFQRGSQQDIHRDTPFFSTVPAYYFVGFWTALEEANEQNGPLTVIKGGHLRAEPDLAALAHTKYPDLDTIDPADPDLWNAYQAYVLNDCLTQGLKVETLPVPKGATVIWHPQLPHGGSPIRNKSLTRHSLVVHTTPTGTPVYHQNAFFNRSKEFAAEPGWSYWAHDSANILQQTHIDIMHKKQVPVTELQ